MKHISNHEFVLEKPLDRIGIVAFLFVLSRILDYITTYIALNLGFTENTKNWLYYGLDNWFAFWVIQIIIFIVVFFILYGMYYYSDRLNSVYLKFFSLLLFWSWFIISWTAPIHNAVHIALLIAFNLMSLTNYTNLLNMVLIGLVFILLSIDLFELKNNGN